MNEYKPHSSHWGAFSGRLLDGKLDILPHPGDPHPSPILGNLRRQPMARHASADRPSGAGFWKEQRGIRPDAAPTTMSRSAGRKRLISWPAN